MTHTLESFVATRQQMSAHGFGDIIGDAQWENDHETQFLVYDDSYWIEITNDSRYMLVLENQSWITGPDKTLSDLEAELYAFTKL